MIASKLLCSENIRTHFSTFEPRDNMRHSLQSQLYNWFCFYGTNTFIYIASL